MEREPVSMSELAKLTFFVQFLYLTYHPLNSDIYQGIIMVTLMIL